MGGERTGSGLPARAQVIRRGPKGAPGSSRRPDRAPRRRGGAARPDRGRSAARPAGSDRGGGRTGMILFVTTADTEILAAERARRLLPEGFPEVRSVNPSSIEDGGLFVTHTLSGARAVVVRLLGGRKAWPDFDAVRA